MASMLWTFGASGGFAAPSSGADAKASESNTPSNSPTATITNPQAATNLTNLARFISPP